MSARRGSRDLSWTTVWQAARLVLVGATAHVALKVAFVVGTILSAVNQGSAVVDGSATWVTGVRVVVNYVVPYIVSSVGYLASFRTSPTIGCLRTVAGRTVVVMVDQALLMIADIGGYTRYMRLHRMSLAHSEDITGRLLKAVVRSAPQLKLIEVEGDAAFFYAPTDTAVSPVRVAAELALTMHGAFHAEQDRLVALNMCSCPGCVEAGKLRVKFVAHMGEVALQTIKRRTQLVGVDVIAVHRMLKNSVPIEEYVLMSGPVYRQSAAQFRERATEIEDELEGLGVATLYFVDLQALAPERTSPPTGTLTRRLRETFGVAARSVPRMLRRQQPVRS